MIKDLSFWLCLLLRTDSWEVQGTVERTSMSPSLFTYSHVYIVLVWSTQSPAWWPIYPTYYFTNADPTVPLLTYLTPIFTNWIKYPVNILWCWAELADHSWYTLQIWTWNPYREFSNKRWWLCWASFHGIGYQEFIAYFIYSLGPPKGRGMSSMLCNLLSMQDCDDEKGDLFKMDALTSEADVILMSSLSKNLTNS